MSVVASKNMPKWAVYALAYKMIKESIDRNCPLQAIAIEESILTDRLSSTLNVGRPKAGPKDSLGRALSEWKPKKSTTAPNANAVLFDAEMDALFPSLAAWWGKRCAMLHGVVKSPQGSHPEKSPDGFREFAMEAAKEGLRLTRKVDNWTKRQIRKAKTASGNAN